MDSARCRPVVVECNLWASCGEPPPLFVVERCSFALCFPPFLFLFLLEQWIDLSCEPGAWLLLFSSLASVWGCACCCNHLLIFLLLGSLLYLDYSTRCQILVEPHSTTNLLRVSSPPFLSQALFVLLFQSMLMTGKQTHGNTFCLFFVFVLFVVV